MLHPAAHFLDPPDILTDVLRVFPLKSGNIFYLLLQVSHVVDNHGKRCFQFMGGIRNKLPLGQHGIFHRSHRFPYKKSR